MYEITILGRGGQGAKTAALFLAESALTGDKYIQAFPEYGPERAGAPVMAYVRISDKPITIHSAVVHTDVFVVIDDTLIGQIDVKEKLKKDGVLIVNSEKSSEEIKKISKFAGNVHVVDATSIAIDLFGKNIPNTPMLGALVKITNVVKLDILKKNVEKKFLGKLGKDITNKNIQAIDRAYKEVK